MKKRLRVAALITLIVIAILWQPGRSHLRAASLLAGFAANEILHDEADAIAGTRARTYAPTDVAETSVPALLLVHGVHWKGIDDPRLRHFARVLAASGLVVVTPNIAELTDYRVDPASIVTIGASARQRVVTCRW